ncbi:MAG TPA: Uma2 family endonuclease [Microbacterium sp.]|nr:Uma2 family endonuclease [Microbacterium sp.]
MTVMTTATRSFLPYGRALTRADLQTMPDDGHRYELIDGALVVTPAPRIRHQDAVRGLVLMLHKAVPANLKLLFAPVDVILADDTVIQPDVLVARRDAFTETDLPIAPLLAVEVLSPSTRGVDLLLKKDRLERAGCQHYWVVDPDEPSVLTWDLVDGTYRQVAHATGTDPFEVALPFALRFLPADLLV